MTVALTDIADALRWLWIAGAIVWIPYAWLHRVEYRRAVLLLGGLFALDFLSHAFAAWAEQPDSHVPSEFPLYSVFTLLAAIAGLLAVSAYARRTQIPLSTIADAALVTIVAGGVGARAYQVWMHWDYYSQRPDDITNLAQGGMGLRGAFISGCAVLLLFAFVRRVSFWKLADAGAIGLALAQSIGWYSASRVGVNYGVVSDVAPAFLAAFAQELPDAYGIVAPRIPVQWFASIFFFVLFIFLVWVGRGEAFATRKPSLSTNGSPLHSGRVFLLYLILSALGGFSIGFLRGDETMLWRGIRVDQWVDLGLAAIGSAFAGMRILQARRVGEISPFARAPAPNQNDERL